MKNIEKSNIIFVLLIVIYFICFNTQCVNLETSILTQCINISSLIFLGIAIVMFEIGYRKDKKKIGIHGIEILVLGIFTLLMKHMPRILESDMKTYIEMGTYGFIIYYVLKSAIMYTKKKQEELKSLSDIKEIVKEEPIKKEAKRRNKKEEGK